MDSPRLSIVIPVYNEGAGIAPVLRKIADSVHTRPLETIIVYDFEEDDTLPVVRLLVPEMPWIRLVRNNLGSGVLNALRTGLASAKAPNVLVMMADGSDEPEIVDRMVELGEAGAWVVAASRYMRGGAQEGGAPVKRMLSRAAGLSLHHLAGVPVHDPTNNFKLYSRRLLESVEIESVAGFELALELTVKAHLMGARLAEVPTTWRDRTAGESKFKLRQWLPHYLRWYRKAMLHRPAPPMGRDMEGSRGS